MSFITALKSKFTKKVPVKSEITIEGLRFADISHWEKINFSKYEPKVLFTKATEGIKNADPTFKNIQAECKARGIRFGAYHFFRNNLPAITQAKHFLNIVKEFDLPPVLDIESLDGSSTVACKQFIKSWLDYVEKETGMVPIIYSGHAFLVALELDESFARYPLWLARYTSITPVAPSPWKEWAIWQFSDKAAFKGIGECDGNIYNNKSNPLNLV